MKLLVICGTVVELKGLIMFSYYQYQINRLGNEIDHADLKLQSDQGETHWMRATPEQIKAILEILKQSEA